MRPRLVAVCAVVLLTAPEVAKAAPTALETPPVLLSGDVVMATPLFANAVLLVERMRPPKVWPILGLTLGAAGIALGLACALPNAKSTDDQSGQATTLGAVMVAEGAANIGLAIWTIAQPSRVEKHLGVPGSLSLHVAPLLPVSGGRGASGLAVSLTGW